MTDSRVPQIAKDVRRLRSDIQDAVRTFPRFHRYGIGQDLRAQARRVHAVVVRYWHEPALRNRWSAQLVHEVDMLKEELQVAKEDAAFPRGFRQFDHLYRQAAAIGRQAGGIRRSAKHSRGQNAQGRTVAQRAQKLSTHAASRGVNA